MTTMPIRDCFTHIFESYYSARQETFAEHAVARFMRSDFPKRMARPVCKRILRCSE